MADLSTRQIIELLRRNIIFKGTQVFGGLNDEDLEDAIDKVHISQAGQGDIIFKQGDKGDSIILLLKGEVDIYVTDESGAELNVATVEENSFFGEMAIIDETERMASVRAKSDCLLGTIFSEDFWMYFHKYQVLAQNVLKGVNQRLRETDESYISRLAKEKKELIRFNQELERQVREKTEQLRQKDLQLLEMDRIAGIGTLAAGIAHEINNPLGFVKSSIGFLKKSLDKMIGAVTYWNDKPIEESLLKEYEDYLAGMNFNRITDSLDTKFDRIERGIERIMKIVNSLRSFSRVDMATVAKLDVNQSIEDALEIMSTSGAKNVEFIKEFQEVPLMTCSPDEINQCLLHVLKNACDAVDHQGLITISTACKEKEGQVLIRITDNGKGMPPEVLRQALHPFFTTKAVGSGTGVGLSLTERLIKRHGGMIDISSKEDEGTSVTMTLPVAGEMCCD